MSTTTREDARSAVVWGLIIFVVLNAFSWKPGWGGRHDRLPGREVERYFGWPACFYCDLWRSDHPHEIDLAAYFPPIPLSREMSFVYCSGSLLAFVLNLTLVVCGTAVVVLLILAERNGTKHWMTPLGIGLGIVGFLIVTYGDEFSAYL